MLEMKAQECKAKGMTYNAQLNDCIEQLNLNCKDDEFINSEKGKCSNYSNLKSFDEDDCEENFSWKFMKCVNYDINEDENDFYREKYQNWVCNETSKNHPLRHYQYKKL
jgi:hypothetical protein